MLNGPNSFNHWLIHNFLHVPIYTWATWKTTDFLPLTNDLYPRNKTLTFIQGIKHWHIFFPFVGIGYIKILLFYLYCSLWSIIFTWYVKIWFNPRLLMIELFIVCWLIFNWFPLQMDARTPGNDRTDEGQNCQPPETQAQKLANYR